ncbi:MULTISPECIES: GNAT family N-acetyltransferase [unclassified Curtobacterium]|jgi:RimJ/RimL family protein N-acetyltransferase|uniref:GNAT family N-acetyltransferase n=1 Tax=unclassified Curtobacterium TaxID=257496 RepID=UPI00052AF351|nr:MULTISPECIES: GNAT family protein [unclassified Curtobacterium]AIV41105.1 amino acid acetyltransferase [Curtobacterium sp. MR_MD2014]MBP1302023.1 RimJ/RimL family protein N-acetyltransferase [Curtobacterium sp. 1310]MCM3505539.1 GNAT family N-acetyltransferase [Curtobacterium sp. ODYSSEY 48 V2]MCM3522334.1 GNAT family N-acetyltransferase [Curtobacterium sp. P97]MDB6427834.1 GNAT family protein [Curtobacterium sp. 20TX0008]
MEIATVPTLTGDRVTLEPLAAEHADDLRAAVADGDLWRTWYTSVPAPDRVEAEIDRRLGEHAAGRMVPFAIRDRPTGRVVGATTFANIDTANRRVEIGYTFLARAAQRSGINTEAKLLLLSHAFDTWDCIAVEFRTHWHNQQSRAAIASLGAKQDGVLRSHSIGRDGTLRDTVVFSITATEWPTVRLSLTERLRTRDRAEGARRRAARHA